MKIRLLILIVLYTTTSFAENKLARINDPDGYTNVRSGQGVDFPVITTLDKDDLFYCEKTDSEWLKIIALKWIDSKQIEGFVHRSKVEFIDYLDNKAKQELLKITLLKQTKLATDFYNAWKSKDSAAHKKTVKLLEEYGELKYSSIIEILPGYYCETKDSTILQLFISAILADAGSANETPSFVIGECYICKPSLVLTQIKNLKTAEQRKLIFDDIEWGLINYYGADENGISDNKDFNRLKKLLETERKKACP
jgi:hypothetical protein